MSTHGRRSVLAALWDVGVLRRVGLLLYVYTSVRQALNHGSRVSFLRNDEIRTMALPLNYISSPKAHALDERREPCLYDFALWASPA